MNRPIQWLFATALVYFAGTATAAQLVVVASTVPGIEPGALIDSSHTLEIPAGRELTLIGRGGKTLRLAGPYSRAPGGGGAKEDSRMLSSLSKLLETPEQETGGLGAMRSAGAAAPTDPWSVDVTRGGSYCFAQDGTLALWRKNSARTGQLAMRNLAGGVRVNTAWPAGEKALAWPGDLPLADGVTYMVRLEGRASAAKIKLTALPDTLPSDAHRAAWMAEHDCERQARRLVASW